jgi:hypothetical protein
VRAKAKHAQHRTISMEIWSAKLALKARVDAAAWLRCISPEEVEHLIASAGSGHALGMSAIRFYRALDEEAALLADYAERTGCELCCAIDAAATQAWLDEHRPSLRFARIEGNRALRAAQERPRRWALELGSVDLRRLATQGSGDDVAQGAASAGYAPMPAPRFPRESPA